jgi:hypothetical protein
MWWMWWTVVDLFQPLYGKCQRIGSEKSDDIFQNDIFSHPVEKKIHQIHHCQSETAVYLEFCEGRRLRLIHQNGRESGGSVVDVVDVIEVQQGAISAPALMTAAAMSCFSRCATAVLRAARHRPCSTTGSLVVDPVAWLMERVG